MSFDTDPADHEKRILAYHNPSSTLWICKSQAEFDQFARDQDVEDVTCIEKYEKAFREEGCV